MRSKLIRNLQKLGLPGKTAMMKKCIKNNFPGIRKQYEARESQFLSQYEDQIFKNKNAASGLLTMFYSSN